jgi:hypothetical protein
MKRRQKKRKIRREQNRHKESNISLLLPPSELFSVSSTKEIKE